MFPKRQALAIPVGAGRRNSQTWTMTDGRICLWLMGFVQLAQKATSRCFYHYSQHKALILLMQTTGPILETERGVAIKKRSCFIISKMVHLQIFQPRQASITKWTDAALQSAILIMTAGWILSRPMQTNRYCLTTMSRKNQQIGSN